MLSSRGAGVKREDSRIDGAGEIRAMNRRNGKCFWCNQLRGRRKSRAEIW